MKVEFDWQDDVHYGVIVFTVPEHKTDHCAEALVQQLNARESKLAELQAERDRLRAAVEVAAAMMKYEYNTQTESAECELIEVLEPLGYDDSHDDYIGFVEDLLTTALSAKGERE